MELHNDILIDNKKLYRHILYSKYAYIIFEFTKKTQK